jgi:uncharacterized repeat protein (TIGR03803 family)
MKNLLRVAILAVLASSVLPVSAQTKTTILNFPGGGRGGPSYSGLVADKEGNLYGTTLGSNLPPTSDVVFKLSRAGGKWIETVLHVFGTQEGDGMNPYSTLTFDGKGNMFGTTSAGAGGSCSPTCGTVYEISPNGVGGWTETVIYAFPATGGTVPVGGVIMDALGNLYGTTSRGGSVECGWMNEISGCGSVYKLTPGADGWTFTNLYYFHPTLTRPDGVEPMGSLYQDAQHNLYGTTAYGGSGNGGTVFELTAGKGGGYRDSLLYSFVSPYEVGYEPTSGLISDKQGNLYGTTRSGGSGCNELCGTVFEMSPTASGWQEQTIYNFGQGAFDGFGPQYGNLAMDAQGNLYGVTVEGGNGSCTYGCGTVYELSPVAGGGWSEKVLYAFQGGADGEDPYGSVVVDAAGNVFGTTAYGGSQGVGTVFEITP